MLTRRIWTALILLGFAGQLAWAVENQFFNTFVYDKITPDPRPISWMVAASAVASTLTAIFMGALSDRTRTRWGRRRPFILFGYLAWGIATAAFPSAALFQPIALAVFLAIAFDCLMTYFGATANDAALNAYVADVTTDENRGRVVGAMEMMTWVALLIVYGGAGLIIQSFGYFTFFYFVGAVVFAFGLIGGWLIREPPVSEPPRESYWQQIVNTFQWQNLRANREFFLVLLAMALWGVAQQVFFPYLIIYLNHFLKVPTLQASLLIFIAIFVGGILLAYPLGLLTDRLGRRRVAFLAIAGEALGLFLFSLARSYPLLAVTGILWLAPLTAWTIATGAWSKDLFPEENRGQFAGYVILFRVALTMIPGPLIGSWLATRYGIPTVLEGRPGFIPTPLIFQASAVATLLAALPLLATSKRQKREA